MNFLFFTPFPEEKLVCLLGQSSKHHTYIGGQLGFKNASLYSHGSVIQSFLLQFWRRRGGEGVSKTDLADMVFENPFIDRNWFSNKVSNFIQFKRNLENIQVYANSIGCPQKC